MQQISGRVIILTIFGIGLTLSAGAWWYHYIGARQAAAFWGSPAGRLIVRGPEVTFYELGELAVEDASEESADEATRKRIAGRIVESKIDLSGKPGLIHLRHVFTQDSNFQWEGRTREPVGAESDWAYAVRFGEGDLETLVLFRRDFERIGNLDGEEVDTLPAPRIAKPVTQYLKDIGALNLDAKSQAASR
jgi:hypothetical protein